MISNKQGIFPVDTKEAENYALEIGVILIFLNNFRQPFFNVVH